MAPDRQIGPREFARHAIGSTYVGLNLDFGLVYRAVTGDLRGRSSIC